MYRGIVRAQLPPAILALWDKIESFAGTQVNAQARPGHLAACDPGSQQATIYLPDPHKISEQDVLHELLHIERYWNEKAPQVQAAGNDPNNHEIGSWLDNMLEHVFIFKRMRRFGLAKDPQREADLQKFETMVMRSEFEKRQNCLAAAMTLEQDCYDDGQTSRAKSVLRAHGMLPVRALARKILGLVERDKPQAARIVRDYLAIPPDGLQQQVFDIRRRTVETRAL